MKTFHLRLSRSGTQGSRRPFPLPHGPAPPLLFFARRFIPANIPDRHPGRGKGHASPWRVCHVPCCGTQTPRRSCGLSCHLQSGHRPRRRGRNGPCIVGRRLASPPARHVLCIFLLFPSPACRRQPGIGHAPPAWLEPHPRSRSLRGWWRRCSRRDRAEASLLAGFVHPRHPGIPPPSLAVAIALGAALRASPSGD